MVTQPMTGSQSNEIFCRSLPTFKSEDRQTIQQFLHHAVADFDYDHPDREEARHIYHEIREGEAIRLCVGTGLRKKTLVVSYADREVHAQDVIDRMVDEAESLEGEWTRIASDLGEVTDELSNTTTEVQIAFEYR